MLYGFSVTTTSSVRTQPVSPLGRSGRNTCSHLPSLLTRSARKVCLIFAAGSSFRSHGFG